MKLLEMGAINAIGLGLSGALAGYCFDYCLQNIFNKDVPWYADVIAGFIAGAITIPGAIILWILKLCGIAMPLIG